MDSYSKRDTFPFESTRITWAKSPKLNSYINYIYMTVHQSSAIGDAFVTAGGVGYNYADILIRSYNTDHVYYTIEFYGK